MLLTWFGYVYGWKNEPKPNIFDDCFRKFFAVSIRLVFKPLSTFFWSFFLVPTPRANAGFLASFAFLKEAGF